VLGRQSGISAQMSDGDFYVVSWRSAIGVKNRLGDTPAHAHSAVNDARSGSSDPDSTRDIVLRLTPASAAACLMDLSPRCARTTWPVTWLVADLADLAAQHGVLVPQHQGVRRCWTPRSGPARSGS